jgi:hypothetical protein
MHDVCQCIRSAVVPSIASVTSGNRADALWFRTCRVTTSKVALAVYLDMKRMLASYGFEQDTDEIVVFMLLPKSNVGLGAMAREH